MGQDRQGQRARDEAVRQLGAQHADDALGGLWVVGSRIGTDLGTREIDLGEPLERALHLAVAGHDQHDLQALGAPVADHGGGGLEVTAQLGRLLDLEVPLASPGRLRVEAEGRDAPPQVPQ